MSKWLIKKGRVIDPQNNVDEVRDILIEKGKIVKVGKDLSTSKVKAIDASGQIVCPGLIDMHVHLREPGREDEETVVSGAKAAIKGGFTSVVSMPNTQPPADNASVVEMIVEKAEAAGLASVYPVAAITKGLKGEEISEMAELKGAGAVAFSDDGNSIMNAQVMRKALEYSKMLNMPLIIHAEDTNLSQGGQMNEGACSTILGLDGIPDASEEVMVSRDIILTEEMGGGIHFAHVSTEGSVELIRQAKKRGVNVTCEVTPHHLILTYEALNNYDTNLKVSPPIRTEDDVKALRKGLKDGTIDAIASDHAPHAVYEKEQEFEFAPCGMIGLETTLFLVLTELVGKKSLSLKQAITKLTQEPARILGIAGGSLSAGISADILIFDARAKRRIDVNSFESKSKNSPFDGWEVKGALSYVFKEGKLVWDKGQLSEK